MTSRTWICPACGYDLRATTSDHCSECGLAIDRDALQQSAIPWAHRRQIGRVRAYLKTLWQFSTDRKRASGMLMATNTSTHSEMTAKRFTGRVASGGSLPRAPGHQAIAAPGCAGV